MRQRGELPPELADCLPELIHETGSDDWEMARVPLPRRESIVYFLKSPQIRLPGVVLKIYRKGAVGKKLAKSLHEAGKYYHLKATALYAVPEPVMSFTRANALAMEWIEAPVAGSLLRKGFHTRRTRDALNRRAAAWLHWFHEQSGIASEPFDADYVTARLEKAVAKVHPVAEAMRQDPFLGTCVQTACRLAREMHGKLVPHATAHGDFTPFNLFIDGKRTIGFDYQIEHRLPVSHDVCRFLVYLESARFGWARADELKEYGCRTRDLETFMEAYPTGRPLLENGLWLRLQFMETTRRWVTLSLPSAKRRIQPLRALQREGLRRNLRLALRSLS